MTDQVKYRVKGFRTTFTYKSSEEKDGKTIVHVVNDETGGLHSFYPDDLRPADGKRKYTTKLPAEMRIPEGRTPVEVTAFGQTVTLL